MSDERNDITTIYHHWLSEYQLTHAPPVAQNNRSERIQWLIILTAVVFISSQHNINFFLNGETGVGALLKSVAIVIMTEGILIKVGERVSKYLPSAIMFHARLIMSFLLGIMALIIAISGNSFDLLETRGYPISSQTETDILQIVGWTAPLMAIFAGVMFTSINQEQQELTDDYVKNRNREWGRFKRKNNVSVSVSIPNGIGKRNMLSNGIPNGSSGKGYSRKSDAMEQAVQFYKDNPKLLNSSKTVQFAKQLGISKTTMYDAKKIVQTELGNDTIQD